MTQYLISFDAHAMDHIPDQEMPAVASAAHAVCQEAISAGVYVAAGGPQPLLAHSSGNQARRGECARSPADPQAVPGIQPGADHPIRRGVDAATFGDQAVAHGGGSVRVASDEG